MCPSRHPIKQLHRRKQPSNWKRHLLFLHLVIHYFYQEQVRRLPFYNGWMTHLIALCRKLWKKGNFLYLQKEEGRFLRQTENGDWIVYVQLKEIRILMYEGICRQHDKESTWVQFARDILTRRELWTNYLIQFPWCISLTFDPRWGQKRIWVLLKLQIEGNGKEHCFGLQACLWVKHHNHTHKHKTYFQTKCFLGEWETLRVGLDSRWGQAERNSEFTWNCTSRS